MNQFNNCLRSRHGLNQSTICLISRDSANQFNIRLKAIDYVIHC